MGSQSKKLGNDYIKMKKLPQRPSIDWFKKNYDMILTDLTNKTDAKIYYNFLFYFFKFACK